MNRSAFFPVIASLCLVACTDPQGSNGSSGGGGAGSSGGTGGTGGSTSTSTSSSSTSTVLGETVTLEMDSFDVPPGGEVYKCQNFANPFGGDADVSAFESHMTPGSHHLLLFYKDVVSNGPLQDCSGLEFAATPYSTQLPDDTVAFPPGVAAAIPPSLGLRLQSHYLNTTAETVTAHVKVILHLAAPGTVTDRAAVLFIVQPNIHIPPNTTQDVTYDCNIPVDMSVIKTASHMHKHGTKFVSTVAGAPFYSTDTWDEPKPAFFDPPMQLHAGDPLHFACTFQNNGPDTLTFGESAQTNEMCILGASFYPAPFGQPTIDCQ